MPLTPDRLETHSYTKLLTVNKLLFLLGANADQVGVDLLTALLSLRPGVSLRKVEVTVAHELQPALCTALHSYAHKHTHQNTFGQKYKIWNFFFGIQLLLVFFLAKWH